MEQLEIITQEPNTSWCLIPPYIWEDDKLSIQEKCLLGRVFALQDGTGKCFAGNEYLGKQLGITSNRISHLITNLINKGYLDREIIYNEKKQIIRRLLWLKITRGIVQNNNRGIVENNKDREDILDKNIEREPSHSKFSKRTDINDEVLLEIAQKIGISKNIVAEKWEDAQNWLDANGKSKKNYKAYLLLWLKKDFNNKKPTSKINYSIPKDLI